MSKDPIRLAISELERRRILVEEEAIQVQDEVFNAGLRLNSLKKLDEELSVRHLALNRLIELLSEELRDEDLP